MAAAEAPLGRRRGRGALLAAAAVLVLGALCAASALGAVRVRDASQHYKVHPDRLDFVLGAGTVVKFTDLKPWTGWGEPKTRARGTEHYNDCKPSCGEGHIRTTPARVRLGNIHRCHGRRVYGRIRAIPKSRKAPGAIGRIRCNGSIR